MTFKFADFYKNSWVDRPPIDAQCDKVPLLEVQCPRCGTSRAMRGTGKNTAGGWLYWKCSKCLNKNSAQHWRCGCNKLWHTCNRHQLGIKREVSDNSRVQKRGRTLDVRGHDLPPPGPEPKKPRTLQETGSELPYPTRSNWTPKAGSVLALRFPHLVQNP